ncbi:hypothetical protein CHLV4088_06440 [Campylobacter helveticus]|uniref:hypothetical protein n=1 Tax=Campylobacter helveticus TaxID=28898 RepID=UPI002149D788|nr:hypothetical protein [Campylobacter helveticus]MCR2057033.1 hypothetical protein [Campylobacter helveticus]MCR2062745.1 hypothetical protein [Campylobacter helveticus]
MKDTEVKDLSYYRVNKAEATEKTKWCFEKFNVEEEKILEEINVKGKYAGDIVEALYLKIQR